MSFRHQFDETNVILDLESSSKEDALREMVDHLARARKITRKLAPTLLEAVLERESQGATGVGKGVALPHAKSPDLKKSLALLARSTAGIDFEAADHKPVTIFFMVLSPEHSPEGHLKVLRWVSSLARQADFRSFVMQATTIPEILGLLEEFDVTA